MAKKKGKVVTKNNTPADKKQINVRMACPLYEKIVADAKEGGRTPPAQVRMILKRYYEQRA